MESLFLAIILTIFLLLVITPLPYSLCMTRNILTKGSFLYVENNKDDILISPNGVFSSGFYQVGQNNAYLFAIWFTNSKEKTIVWIANRDYLVNGRFSKLKLTNHGNLNLFDADQTNVWSTNTVGALTLELLDSGNLVLRSLSTVWQSFDSPTNTLLPQQLLTKEVRLVSSRSQTNFSSGFYKLFFDNDNVMRLLFDGLDISSIYWPDIQLVSWEAGRTTYNNSKVASFDSLGQFISSDHLQFNASDFGLGPYRRLTLDFDGNLRMYSLQLGGIWRVTWEAFPKQCDVHGLCGPNSVCKYVPDSGRKCTCLPGFKLKNSTDWAFGCEPTFDVSIEDHDQVEFIEFPHVEFFGYDYTFLGNYTFEECSDYCLNLKEDCKAFLLKYNETKIKFNCYPKTRLLNGYQSPDFPGMLYVKVPKNATIEPSHDTTRESQLICNTSTPGAKKSTVHLQREYDKRHKGRSLKFLLWFASGVGIVEMTCIFLVTCFLFRRTSGQISKEIEGFAIAGFKRFTFEEIKKATLNFSHEIGRGGCGIVYQGKLEDGRVAAIKKLQDASPQEAEEFLAEISTIGKLNHMNLIQLWGYCIEGKKRLLVFEYMENKSLAHNLFSNSLSWETRYQIALGTARGLAYLHDECLEWVLHCDVKPHNILLDANYQPKVADFGLSKLLDRNRPSELSFSRIRGTRGYMAPEWVTNVSITSKVDVYSYGVVVLEMVTGKSQVITDVVTWVREKKNEVPTMAAWIEEIADSMLEGNYKNDEMQTLAIVALQCVEEEKDARPSMHQVVEMLQGGYDE